MIGTAIDLDRKTKAIRDGNTWAVYRRQPNGSWVMEETWAGSRRSLVLWCEKHGVWPSREAEAMLAALPEGTGFRERT